MLQYVGEEVERVKELFEQKERRLVGDARAAAAAAASEASPQAGSVLEKVDLVLDVYLK